jgi:hypothetical protein
MMSFIKRHPVLVFVISFLAIIGSLNCSGFCFKEMRYISDDEAIKVFLNKIFRLHASDSGLVPYGYSDTETSALFLNQFLKEHPDCCQAMSWRNWKRLYTPTDNPLVVHNGWFTRICGLGGAIVVRVEIAGQYQDEIGFNYNIPKTGASEVVITNCGEVYQWK